MVIRPVVSLLVAALVWLLLWFPVAEGLVGLDEAGLRWQAGLSSLGILLLGWSIYGLTGRRGLVALVPLVLLLVLLRFTWLGLIQFTGMGFTVEFFIHLEWESIRIAWQEYGRLARRAVIAMVLLALVLAAGARWLARPDWRRAAGAAILGLALVVGFRETLPEGELYQAWREFDGPALVEVDDAVLERWQETGLVETEIPDKRRITAEAGESPRNLVLLYLESVGVALADHPDWPDLMPNFRQLLEDHGWVDAVQTSSYITIEGLTNTQCGTLFPFGRGSDSLAGGEGLADFLPCLGDVLGEAGYHQKYLGGAGMGFAGKGEFLRSHGYDARRGLEYWRDQGLDSRPGKWGLSDSELFDQSIEKLAYLRERPDPFNLTLLTIGTHIPGYFYRECEEYPDSDHRFVQALHCGDQLLGKWIDSIRESGALEDTVVVITADHHIFPNPEMRELFGDAVDDRRMPFIVLGPEVPESAMDGSGAGYDLAPTVLDLLDIEHDARFALGRSLVGPVERPDYQVKRFRDIHQGRTHEPGQQDCDEEVEEVQFPLDACDKRELMAVLGELTRTFSREQSRFGCNTEDVNRLRLPEAPGKDLSILLSGRQQSGSFTWRSRPVDPADPGLYLIELDEDGTVVVRLFVPEDQLQDDLGQEVVEDLPDAHRWLALWRPGEEAPESMNVLGMELVPDRARAAFIEPDGTVVAEDAVSADAGELEGELEMELPGSLCQRHFPQAPEPE